MFEISLAPEETKLATFIFESWPQLPATWTNDISSSQQTLFDRLINRKAIPNHRLRWFCEPSLNIGGRGKSRDQVFARNGTHGHNIFRHPNFHRYLRYFIYGPHLPDQLMASYADFVKSLKNPITSGDVEPLQSEARRLFRSFNCDRSDAAEFHKLALELDLDESQARYIYTAVKQIR